jgi:DNA-binding Lrp family transcriptional regulator
MSKQSLYEKGNTILFKSRDQKRRVRKMKAYILLSTKPGTSLEVVKRIKEKVKETIVADAIFGRYDAIIVLEAPALENINQVVYKIIEKDPNVIRTETSIVLSPMQP